MTLSDTDLRLCSAVTREAIPGFSPTYTDYADLVSRITDHPFTADIVGADAADNSIYRLSYGPDSLPVLVISACLHGSETLAADMTVEFLRRWAESSDPEFVWLRRNYRCVALPCCCPSGYDNLEYLNANAVNLNRNFDYRWSEYDDSSPQNYKGTAAWSEPESQVVRDQVALCAPLLAIDVHTSTGAGGIDANAAAANGALYRPYLLPVQNSLAALSPMTTIPYSVMSSPTASGYCATQPSAGGYDCMASLMEMRSDTTSEEATSYGMTAIHQMAVQAKKLFTLKAKL